MINYINDIIETITELWLIILILTILSTITMYSHFIKKYRNNDKNYQFEKDTETTISDLITQDDLKGVRYRTTSTGIRNGETSINSRKRVKPFKEENKE